MFYILKTTTYPRTNELIYGISHKICTLFCCGAVLFFNELTWPTYPHSSGFLLALGQLTLADLFYVWSKIAGAFVKISWLIIWPKFCKRFRVSQRITHENPDTYLYEFEIRSNFCFLSTIIWPSLFRLSDCTCTNLIVTKIRSCSVTLVLIFHEENNPNGFQSLMLFYVW